MLDVWHTFNSAQPLTFHADYYPERSRLVYTVGTRVTDLRFHKEESSTKIEFLSEKTKASEKEVVRRFRLEDDMKRMYDEINTDKNMSDAIKRYSGMRVTLNDPWETTLCFLVSQLNNVKRIRKIVRNIKKRYGKKIYGEDNTVYYSIPDAETLSSATVKDLMECGAGFRARYIINSAKYCRDNMNLESLRSLKYQELKEELMRMDGVGEKVADCIALMGYGKLEAFPIDVWVKRTMERLYFEGKNTRIRDIRKFAEDRWGRYAGFAQQYIFWYGRDTLGR